jgi:hypothetical protein
MHPSSEDPLGLREISTPTHDRSRLIAPTADISSLHRRLTGSHTADSVELRLVLLAHLVFLAYSDLKEHTIK